MSRKTIFRIKFWCYAAGGFLTPIGSGLAQWVNSGEWPPGIVWLVVSSFCGLGAVNAILAFLSKSSTRDNEPELTPEPSGAKPQP